MQARARRCQCGLVCLLVLAAGAGAGAAGRTTPGITSSPQGTDPTAKGCPQGAYGGTVNGKVQCRSCAEGYTTRGSGAVSPSECVVQPGWGTDSFTKLAQPCDKGSFSTGGTAANPGGECVRCAGGFTTQTDESTRPEDCNICLPGRGGLKCAACPVNTYSYGGRPDTAECEACDPGRASARGAASADECFEAVEMANFDNLIVSSSAAAWARAPTADTQADCSKLCTGTSKAVCVAFRWSDAASDCQLLLEAAAGKLMGFKVSGGATFSLFTVPQSVKGAQLVRSLKGQSLRGCANACGRNNNCEAFTYPGRTVTGAECQLWMSVLDADWVSGAHVKGTHLFTLARG